ncbi:endospore germination permease [Bacillus sp. RO1]|uniref:GerAB/ArcD/ProY family transporter n=1 Tax=Bacillus sp. RO1 TaxID=2722703 RepID=UPI0014563974|nr:endospore germination permease [Bacillus sp. RO1]NLP51678.1 endospore germination permease [Bacillus sp. RO1]
MQNVTKILIPRQLFLMLILSTGLLNHVILIPNLLNAAGRDSWIGVIIAYPIALVFSWLVYFITKNSSDEGFFSMVEKRFGKVVSAIISLPVVVYLFLSAYITLRDLIIWLNSYFLSDSSVTMINFIMILVCCVVTLGGIKYMAISSGFLLPLVMIFGIFIAITNTTIKDPSLLFPLLSEGYTPVIKGIIYSLSGLFEIYLVILLQPYSQSPIKFRHVFILITLLMGLILGPLTAAIMEFGPVESANFRYPAYEQWRVLNIGDYISQLDFFALYQWLSGAIIRIGLFIYLAAAFFTKKKKHYKVNAILVVCIYVIFFGVMWMEVETFYFYEFIYRYFLPACMAFFLFQILISALLVLVMRKREGSHGKQNTPGM